MSPIFSPAQCRAGRELAHASREALAVKAGVSLADVVALETGEQIPDEAYRSICRTLYDRFGVLPVRETELAGEGVRFRQNSTDRTRKLRRRASAGFIEPRDLLWARARALKGKK